MSRRGPTRRETVHRTVSFKRSNLCSPSKKEPYPVGAWFFFGGLEEIRTPDPRNANAMRSQLRYEPLFFGGCAENYTAGRNICQEAF